MGRSSGKLFFGFVLIVLGTLWLLNNIGAIYFDLGELMDRAWPVAIIVLGLWLLVGGRHRKVIAARVSGSDMNQALGDIDYAPGEIGPDGLNIAVSAGEVHLDLTGTALRDAESKVEVKIGLGDVRIRAPRDVPLRVEGKTGIGDLYLLDRHADGFGARLDYQDPAYSAATKRLQIIAKAGLGDVRVTRA